MALRWAPRAEVLVPLQTDETVPRSPLDMKQGSEGGRGTQGCLASPRRPGEPLEEVPS